ncbi:hypothetical protein GGS23DRAFT_611808 [Durotheca rogersii]|uniref:uncharacterized protein n=1 Tax=Durotheca rogersii TaxID=419775 RepID=UPI0022210352|nr:uncharacterized protein GGS23DRAFT_611808 [Durotheca rogersii]KAI5861673.1 hypothetical protein GGS23DRAFT_611808 [Durotheca rogersii]
MPQKPRPEEHPGSPTTGVRGKTPRMFSARVACEQMEKKFLAFQTGGLTIPRPRAKEAPAEGTESYSILPKDASLLILTIIISQPETKEWYEEKIEVIVIILTRIPLNLMYQQTHVKLATKFYEKKEVLNLNVLQLRSMAPLTIFRTQHFEKLQKEHVAKAKEYRKKAKTGRNAILAELESSEAEGEAETPKNDSTAVQEAILENTTDAETRLLIGGRAFAFGDEVERVDKITRLGDDEVRTQDSLSGWIPAPNTYLHLADVSMLLSLQ